MSLLSITFASTFNCNTYGGGTYNEAGSCTDTNPVAGLAPTGQNAFIGIGIGLFLIVAAIIILIRVRSKMGQKNK